MPSLKMKTKSSKGCLREKNGLHVCRQSSMIFKDSSSCVRSCVQAEELDSYFQNEQDVPVCKKVDCPDIEIDNITEHQELPDVDNLQSEEQPVSLAYAEGEMESTVPSIAASSLETIFSPVLELNNIPLESEFDNFTGNNVTLDVQQLGPEDSNGNCGSASECQICNVSDLYIPERMIAGLHDDGNSGYNDLTGTVSLPDYRCNEPSSLIDSTEEYMILPFLVETMETSCEQDARTSEDTVLDSDNSSLYLAIHQLKSCDQEDDVNFFSDLAQEECFDPRIFFRNMPDLPEVAADMQSDLLTKDCQATKSVTLVLDLDETLVHSTLEPCDNTDFTFPVFFNMKEHTVYVKRRPYLQMFLEKVAQMFEIVVFTASQSIYASQLLDILDPDGRLISGRAYRESCTFSDGSYTKDLTVLGVDLAKVVIIDNSPQVFQLQINNGIPIKSWFDDQSDSALFSLLPFLETLVDVDDVRPIIAKRFGNKE
ncbi:CTD small phosphatase-like protein 2 [Impatiens glandulifera]|uniref:CTD small phosphatase-like protein 2 n=1 Tax=Impatiens glandulifera TaxID=253017 RepID=UPI001FB0CD36|nr:CTD small phosphatase-like protein 2 [Impatiens glandulifera]